MTRFVLALVLLASLSSVASSASQKLMIPLIRNPYCPENGGVCLSALRSSYLKMKTSSLTPGGFSGKLTIRGAEIGGLPANDVVRLLVAFDVNGGGCASFLGPLVTVTDGNASYHFTSQDFPDFTPPPGAPLALCTTAPGTFGPIGTQVTFDDVESTLVLGIHVGL